MRVNLELRARSLLAAGWLLWGGAAHCGEVSYSGTAISSSMRPVFPGFAILGTFKPGFDVYAYSYVYGVDAYGNMSTPNYGRAVADGTFRPVGRGTMLNPDGSFADRGNAVGIQGQQLYLFVLNSSVPDLANEWALCTGTTPAWLGPSTSGAAAIDAASASSFVAGGGGFGGPIQLNILPLPEPSTTALAGIGVVFIAVWARTGRGML